LAGHGDRKNTAPSIWETYILIDPNTEVPGKNPRSPAHRRLGLGVATFPWIGGCCMRRGMDIDNAWARVVINAEDMGVSMRAVRVFDG